MGGAGQQLYGLFWDAGLTHITAHAVVHIITDYAEAVRSLEIRERAQLAKEAGVISEEECAARNTLQIKRAVEMLPLRNVLCSLDKFALMRPCLACHGRSNSRAFGTVA